jgi:diguanylate cyclase (GGDEF)-like protein
MNAAALLLILEALVMYFLVLGAHALRTRYGPAHFYALLGGVTAIMSWVTDAGLAVEIAGITFVVGSTVFYTSLLLGVFVVYVFDGPVQARVAISTVMAVSILMPVTAAVLHDQAGTMSSSPQLQIPEPSLRINAASVFTTLVDLVFLGMAWEFLGRVGKKIKLWLRTYLTLLAVMMLDVVLFSTGAFAGTPNYLSIMGGTFSSRLVISLFALPVLYGYLSLQSARKGVAITNRPVMAILSEYFDLEEDLTEAQKEIERRRQVERERDQMIQALEESRAKYKELSERLHRVSITDELTGTANRRYLNMTLEKEWKRAVRNQTQLSLILIDIDNFKQYNDQYGHLAGDQGLRDVAQALESIIKRPADLLARFGGDEFAAVLPNTDRTGAQQLAETCRRAVSQQVDWGPDEEGTHARATISIGVSTALPDREGDYLELIHQADRALYQAKSEGGNRVEFLPYSPED